MFGIFSNQAHFDAHFEIFSKKCKDTFKYYGRNITYFFRLDESFVYYSTWLFEFIFCAITTCVILKLSSIYYTEGAEAEMQNDLMRDD